MISVDADTQEYLFQQRQDLTLRPVSDEDRQLGGTIKLVLDVVQYDDSVHQAMLYACGNALVCDTMEEARSFSFRSSHSGSKRYKVVTLEGDVIEKNGNMTGGSSRRSSSKQSSQWDDQQVAKIRKECDEMVTVSNL